MTRVLIVLALLAGFCTRADAESVAEFYKGKTIRVIVGQPSGDIYDTWARLIVRHMRGQIPGNPNMIVENMPGGGTLIAANFIYNRAPQDGTTLGSVSRNIPHYAFTKRPNVQFDPLKFTWIGSPELTGRGCYARVDSGVTEAAQLFERELVVGTDGAGTAASETPNLLRNLLGMKFRTVDGYHGTDSIGLAIERKEVSGICQTIAGFEQVGRQMLDNGTVRLLLTIESKRGAPRRADGFRVHQDRRTTEDPVVQRFDAGARTAVAGAAEHSGRTRHGAAGGVRRDHAGRDVPGGGEAARPGGDAAHRRGA